MAARLRKEVEPQGYPGKGWGLSHHCTELGSLVTGTCSGGLCPGGYYTEGEGGALCHPSEGQVIKNHQAELEGGDPGHPSVCVGGKQPQMIDLARAGP